MLHGCWCEQHGVDHLESLFTEQREIGEIILNTEQRTKRQFFSRALDMVQS